MCKRHFNEINSIWYAFFSKFPTFTDFENFENFECFKKPQISYVLRNLIISVAFTANLLQFGDEKFLRSESARLESK